MEIFTIGFTQKTAKQFFGMLRQHGIECMVDTQLSKLLEEAEYCAI